jgi:hypothetical protein
MTPADPVTEFLLTRGCSEQVVREGFPGLLGRWESIAQDVAAGYDFAMEDYLNDLDARQILAEALPHVAVAWLAEFQARLDAADELFRKHTTEIPECLWGDENAFEMNWTPSANWWYYRIPEHPGPGFPG